MAGYFSYASRQIIQKFFRIVNPIKGKQGLRRNTASAAEFFLVKNPHPMQYMGYERVMFQGDAVAESEIGYGIFLLEFGNYPKKYRIKVDVLM